MTGTGTAATSVVVERRVSASPGRVWETITDLRELPRLLSGVSRIEVLTEGGFDVGTRWRETRRTLGKEATEELTVTACEPPDRYVTTAASHGMRYVSELTLAPDGTDATTLRMAFTARPADGRAPGLLGRLTGLLGGRMVAKALAKDLTELARAVESRF
ncbi:MULTISPECIES: SRPBCC family protein [unclassified Streptomyces]|uniref:SRPBCC family protein n=1 Tax=unclassified Streptomyces TaxID=2593676 RepID=UPI0016617E95|nr:MULTISPECIES: SRPBCC family protein [unclassified Streptomyces]MBD0708622.1 polyketide cyclase/dehydrase [Streptomyces sp. CBMA291]MBD0713115.1 polyketide cyclase/dehydrase [Streptomyces sp. CBMA370]